MLISSRNSSSYDNNYFLESFICSLIYIYKNNEISSKYCYCCSLVSCCTFYINTYINCCVIVVVVVMKLAAVLFLNKFHFKINKWFACWLGLSYCRVDQRELTILKDNFIRSDIVKKRLITRWMQLMQQKGLMSYIYENKPIVWIMRSNKTLR